MLDEQQLININYYYYNKTQIDALLSSYAKKNHTHSNYLTNASLNTKVDIAQGTDKALKNVVTDANGNITIENKPYIPATLTDLTDDIGLATQTDINTLNNKISQKVNTSDIKNNLTSTDTNKPLSAKQGKELKTLVDNKASSIHNHTTLDVTDPNAYSAINTTVDATQENINTNINDKINTLLGRTNVATSSVAGLLSGSDKTKLDYCTTVPTVAGTSNDNINFTGSNNTVINVKTGTTISVYFMKPNNDNATFNLNNKGIYPIFYNGRAVKAGEIPVKAICLLMFTTWTTINSGNGAWMLFHTPQPEENENEETTPISHASEDTTYGVGDSTHYGHVKVDDDMSANSVNPVENRVVKDYVDTAIGGVVSGGIDLSQTHEHDDRYFTELEITDQLNTKLNKGIQIPNDADLNTYTNEGFYFYPSTSGSKNILNYPECDPTTLKNSNADAFTLLVEKISSSSPKQTLTMFNANNANPRTFIRIKKANGQPWQDWKEVEFKGHTHDTANGVTPGFSLNNFTTDYKNALDNLNTTISNAVSNLEMIEIVSTLPTSNIKTNKMYLKANSVNGTNNKYDVYIRVNNTWEKIDSLDFNISDYAKKSDLQQVATSGSYNHLVDTPSIPTANATASNIKMDGVQNAGSLDSYAKADHIHPINQQIPNEADLNTYIDPGFYWYPSSSNAKNISNYPEGDANNSYKNPNANAFTLLIEKISNNSVKQTLTIYNSTNVNPRTFIRIKKADGTWNNWKEIEYKGHTHSIGDGETAGFSTNDFSNNYKTTIDNLHTVATTGEYTDLNNIPSIPEANNTNANIKSNGIQNAGTLLTYAKADHVHPINASIKKEDNLNDYIVPGFYYCTGSTIGKDVLNYPECDPTTLKNSNANGFTLLVEKLNDSSTKQTLTVYNSTNVNPRTFIRIKLANSTGNWNDWKEIEYKGHIHSTNDITGTIATNQIANTAITIDKINSNVYDTTNGGTSGSNKLITSGAVYNGLNTKSPTNHGHGKISPGGTITETTNSVRNVVVTDTTNNNIRVINKVPFANLDGVAASNHVHTYEELENKPDNEWVYISDNYYTDIFDHDVTTWSGSYTHAWFNSFSNMILCRFHAPFLAMQSATEYTWDHGDNIMKVKDEYRPKIAIHGSAVTKRGSDVGIGTIWVNANGYFGGIFNKTYNNNGNNINVYGTLIWCLTEELPYE